MKSFTQRASQQQESYIDSACGETTFLEILRPGILQFYYKRTTSKGIFQGFW